MARPGHFCSKYFDQMERTRMSMSKMKNRFVLSALSFAILGVMGCTSMQQPAPASGQATAPATSATPDLAQEQVHAEYQFGGVLISIYHPDTRTLYVWSGDPRPASKRPMVCYKFQISDTPSGAPISELCTPPTPAPSGNAH
jgi:hypothetical protein